MSIRRSRPFVVVSLLASTLMISCQGASERAEFSETTNASVRDSAGIEIVDNAAPAWGEDERWRLSEEPVLDIGSIDGSPEYTLGRAHSPVRLSDGTIVVADMIDNRLRFYSSDGSFLRFAGGSGQGPGEFEQLYRMRKITGDSLMALSPPSATSIFSPAGEYQRRFNLDFVPGRGNMWWVGYLEGGALFTLSLQREGTVELERPVDSPEGVEFPRFERPERDEFYRDTLQHFLFTMEGELVDSVAKLPSQFLAENRTFAPNAAYGFHEDKLFHSPANVTEIRRFRAISGEDGHLSSLRLEQIVRRTPLRTLVLTDEDKETYLDRERARIRARAEQSPGQFDASFFERRLLETRFPDSIPDHGNRMYVDPDGTLFLQEYRLSDDEPFEWSVFDPDGRWLGVLVTPADFTVNEIGTDYVLGIGKDQLDVDHVRMYRLVKPN